MYFWMFLFLTNRFSFKSFYTNFLKDLIQTIFISAIILKNKEKLFLDNKL